MNFASEQRPTMGRKLVVKSQPVPESRMGGGSTKKFKSMLSELEACQCKMFKAMDEFQQTSMNAIHAGVSSATVSSMKPTTKDSGDVMSKDVYVERANVEMFKLNSILKSKDAKKGAGGPCGSHQRWPLPDENDATNTSAACASVRAANIGGASMGAYSGLLATELGSHANMAVAGADCPIIAKKGN